MLVFEGPSEGELSFEALFKLLVRWIAHEDGQVFMLYLLMHNIHFSRYLFSRTDDIEPLVSSGVPTVDRTFIFLVQLLPILGMLAATESTTAEQVHLLQSILLLLSADVEFSRQIFNVVSCDSCSR